LSEAKRPACRIEPTGEHEAAQARRHPDRKPDHAAAVDAGRPGYLLASCSDPDILHCTEGDDVRRYDLAQVQQICRGDGVRRSQVRKRP